MKPFLERLAVGRSSFRGLGMGETAALSLSKGMRRGRDSPVNKLLKKQAVSLGTKERVSWYSPISIENTLRS
jgi:hypothetical protein